MQRLTWITALVCFAFSGVQQAALGAGLDIDDFNTWTLVQDPPHAGMTANINSATQATLFASGAVPVGTDIGYQSVNGNTVASSSAGHYFSAAQDFQIAVDFDVSALNSVGLAIIGFGIGEEGTGENSAGPVLAFANGAALVFSGAARANDNTLPPQLLGLAATASGRFFVEYQSASSDIIFGVSSTPGSAAPTETGTFTALGSSWPGEDLLVSFFLRSDTLIYPPLTTGTVNAVFSNFEILSGEPLRVVPEPPTPALVVVALLLAGVFRRRS